MGACSSDDRQGLKGQSQAEQTQPPAWLKQFDIQEPALLCPSSNSISRMCISRHCRNIALFCSNSDCKSCLKIHPQCGNVKLQFITQLIQKRAELQRQLVLRLEEIEIKTFQSIQAKRTEYLQNFFLDGFDQKYANLVQGIFLGTKTIHINGQIAEEFYWRLKDSNAKLANSQSQTLKYFKRQMERISVPLMTLERQVLDHYLLKSKVMTQEQERDITVAQSQLKENNFTSMIIGKRDIDRVKFINESLDYPKKLKLVFRASENGFQASRFHEKCDNIAHTFTLVETQYGKLIGGYTPLIWNFTKNGFAADKEGIGFLLAINDQKKLSLTKPEKAIQCIPQYGPVFGSGADLAISDECHKINDSCVNFPFSYNNKTAAYRFNQQAWTSLCGAPEGKKFLVKQYEVYEVIW